jgi:hypothetical protein
MFPTNEQLGEWADQYGMGTALLIGIIVSLFLIVKFWPRLVAFVNSVEVVRNLPSSLDEIKTQIADSGADKSKQIGQLRTTVEARFEKYDQLAEVSMRERAELRRMNLDSLEERAEMREAIREIRHEVNPNGGRSMKDSLVRLEEQVEELRKQVTVTAPATAPVTIINR